MHGGGADGGGGVDGVAYDGSGGSLAAGYRGLLFVCLFFRVAAACPMLCFGCLHLLG